MAFKLIKRELGLHLFWSAKTGVLLQQVWAVLLISQILHGLQLEIAAKAGVDPFDVSLPLLVEYSPAGRMSILSPWPLTAVVTLALFALLAASAFRPHPLISKTISHLPTI